MVFQALHFIHPRKPGQLLTARKISSHYDLRDENSERRVEASVQTLLEAVENKTM
jgi:hypothetical protein